MKLEGETIKTFGYKAPELERIDTPAGAICPWCEEPIAGDDCGIVMRAVGDVPHQLAENPGWVAVHLECNLRQVFGSVGHQKGRCSCHGGTEEDPSGLSRRQAAKAAVGCWFAHHPDGEFSPRRPAAAIGSVATIFPEDLPVK